MIFDTRGKLWIQTIINGTNVKETEEFIASASSKDASSYDVLVE